MLASTPLTMSVPTLRASAWLTVHMPGRTIPKNEVSSIYRVIGKAIRDAREGSKLSQQDLATAVRMSRTSITNLENGNQQVPLHTLYEIAEALRVDVRSLLPDVPPASETRSFGDEDVDRWATQLQKKAPRRVSA